MNIKLLTEIKRIHTLTYGHFNENFFDNLTNKIDDPKKADYVSEDINKFYESLNNAIESGGLSEQSKGSMVFQKNVESMQIGLIILGYNLPTHGVDGLFGPETANSVKQFAKDNLNVDLTTPIVANGDILKKMVELLKQKNINDDDIKKYIDQSVTTGGKGFTDINLSTEEGVKKYSIISQTYINTKNSSSEITGDMLANGAKMGWETYHKYLPPELALAQLTIEGGLSKDPNSKPNRTNNPFNVGNVDSGKTNSFPDKQSAINTYYSLMCKNYLSNGKTAADLLKSFTNKNGNRYASSGNYENMLGQVVSQVNKISQNVDNSSFV